MSYNRFFKLFFIIGYGYDYDYDCFTKIKNSIDYVIDYVIVIEFKTIIHL
jgi:hypothetical protein